MQEAFGGILNIFLILIFLVIVEGILAFTVSYTKAFRMKNYVIATIEQYEGSGCFDDSGQSACMQRIQKRAAHINYRPTVKINCPYGQEAIANLFCANPEGVSCASEGENSTQYRCYRIVTQVDINFPIVNKIMGLEFFQVSGETRTIRKPS